jgi:hypothetical protein
MGRPARAFPAAAIQHLDSPRFIFLKKRHTRASIEDGGQAATSAATATPDSK